ncbi:MAG: hypothetical protein RLZZ141_2279 [Pseudomonadota bacterium]
MKLATFSQGSASELGVVLDGERIVSLSRAAPSLARNMIDLIARWPQIEGEVRRIAAEAKDSLALADVHLHAPVRRPGKIMAIGLNYADHIAESNMGTPEHQIWFTKAVTSINGPYDPIQIPKVSQAVDYEAELVAVIGTGGRHISKDNAASAVFGYCVGNDVTERGLWARASTPTPLSARGSPPPTRSTIRTIWASGVWSMVSCVRTPTPAIWCSISGTRSNTCPRP